MDEKAIVREVLGQLGSVSEISEVTATIDNMACFEGITWEPQLLFKVDGRTWGVDLLASGDLRSRRIDSMTAAQKRCGDFQSAVFVGSSVEAEQVVAQCDRHGIAVVYPLGDRYVLHRAGSARNQVDTLATPAPCRIPACLVERVQHLPNVRPSFATPIAAFADEHTEARKQGYLTDEREAQLLGNTLDKLVTANQDYFGTHGYEPVEMLRKLEQWSRHGGFRDHYFHTFQDFLLGMVVLNGAYEHFRDSMVEVMPATGNTISTEYVWFLTALFHDVGYAVQRRSDWDDVIYGPSVWYGTASGLTIPEEIIADNNNRWNSSTYRQVRMQLVSLYNHLCQNEIREDWTAEPFEIQALLEHPLDRTATDDFLYGGHASASALRLGLEVGQAIVGQLDHDARRFTLRHGLLAALSIPFHDGRFRRRLREHGIGTLRTRRFPFAALLAFIDSIQDDRREDSSPQAPDVLQYLQLDGSVVRPVVNVGALQEDRLAVKRLDAADLNQFLDPTGGLRYEYPDSYLSESSSTQ